jgi:Ca2+:H+ antiporter
MMYLSSLSLLQSYLIGLWFSLKTHATQIWQNPQQLMHPFDFPQLQGGHGRATLYHRLLQTATNSTLPTHGVLPKPSDSHVVTERRSGSQTPVHRERESATAFTDTSVTGPSQPEDGRAPTSPTLADRRRNDLRHESVLVPLTDNIIVDEFSRAFAAATANALRHGVYPQSPAGPRLSTHDGQEDPAAHGHDAPSWSRTTSASVLLACTALYAAIAGKDTVLLTILPIATTDTHGRRDSR